MQTTICIWDFHPCNLNQKELFHKKLSVIETEAQCAKLKNIVEIFKLCIPKTSENISVEKQRASDMRVTVLSQLLENLRILLQVMGRELQKEGFSVNVFLADRYQP